MSEQGRPPASLATTGFVVAFSVPALLMATTAGTAFPIALVIGLIVGAFLTVLVGLPLYLIWPEPLPRSWWPYVLVGAAVASVLTIMALLVVPIISDEVLLTALLIAGLGGMGGLMFWLVTIRRDWT